MTQGQVAVPCASTVQSLRDAPWFPDSAGIIGRALLDRIQAIYATFGVELPKRQVWSVGEVPPDCDQLVVSLQSLDEGVIAGEIPSPCEVPVNATYTVSVSRCHPVDPKGGATNPEVLGKAADAAARDAYLLMKLSGCLDMYGADVPGSGQIGGMGTEASVEISGPQGGMVTTTLTLKTVIG
jgi:hypothetical protein